LLDKYINLIILFLLGCLSGFSIFLTFIVAPLMFSHFNTRLAGEIMNVIFPYYFSAGWIIGIVIYTLIALLSIKNKHIIKKLKVFIIALSILIVSYMALHKAILPIAQNLNNTYYYLLDKKEEKKATEIKVKFERIHIVSSTLNMINFILVMFLFYRFYYRIIKD